LQPLYFHSLPQRGHLSFCPSVLAIEVVVVVVEYKVIGLWAVEVQKEGVGECLTFPDQWLDVN